MSYVPTEWKTGDVITAERLNKAEQGIKDAHDNAADISSEISTEVASWLDEHVNVTEGVNIDDTLSVAGSAADSKATGTAIGELKSAVDKLTDTIKFPIIFGAKGINGDTGVLITSTTRKAGFNEGAVYLKSGTKIITNSTIAKMKLVKYSSNSITKNTFVSISNSFESEFTIESDGYYTVLVAKIDDSTISDADKATIESNTEVYINIDLNFNGCVGSEVPFATYSANGNGLIAAAKSAVGVLVMLKSKAGVYYIKSSSYVFRWVWINNNQNKIDSASSDTQEKTLRISNGEELYLVVKKSDGSNISDSDIEPMLQDLSIVYTSDAKERLYSYVGEKITLKQTFDYRGIGTIASSVSSNALQGIAQYDDKLIALYNTGYFEIYNLNPFSSTAIASGTLASSSADLHANCCTFGNFYAETDAFPLLYVTGGTPNSIDGYCTVERFQTQTTPILVQTITIDRTNFATKDLISEYPAVNFYVDENSLWTFGSIYRSNGSQEAHDNENKFVLHRYALPPLTSATVVLTADDVLDEFLLPYNTFFQQGGTAYSGKLFVVFGAGGVTKGTKSADNTLRVYNLNGGYEMAQIDLSTLSGHDTEIESASVYGNDLLINYVDGHIYALTF